MNDSKTHMLRINDEKLFIRAKTRAAHEMVSLIALVEKALKDYLKKPIDK